MKGQLVVYKMAVASLLWRGGSGQQIPIGLPSTTENMRPSISSAALLAGSTVHALEHSKGIGRLPALGWNSWNAFHCDIDDSKIFTAAKQLVALGLKDVGYEYVNIDDCWSVKEHRDQATQELIPDPVKFPRGIAGLAEEVHSLGLKFGIYGSAGTMTCAAYPAQIGYEYIDAATFARWGVDYLKYDNCFVPGNWADEYQACVPDEGGPYPNGTCPNLNNAAPEGYDWSTSNSAKRYNIMRDALLAQDRPIFYSLCEWGQAHVEFWGNDTAQSWRMSGDITPDWPRIVQIMNVNSFLMQYTNFWGHADADMLEIGNGDITLPESRSHFAFWAAMKSPLMIGTALDVLAADKIAILKNPFLLDFNQDEVVGGAATPYKWGVNPDWTFNATNPAEYWSGSSSKGTLVLALNSLGESAVREIKWEEVPQLEKAVDGSVASFQVTEIWTGKNLGCVKGGIRQWVASHDTIGYLVGGKCTTLSWW